MYSGPSGRTAVNHDLLEGLMLEELREKVNDIEAKVHQIRGYL